MTEFICNFHLIDNILQIAAETIGHLGIIRGFLDPDLEKKDLLYGVSFASAASGYDDLTANLSVIIFL